MGPILRPRDRNRGAAREQDGGANAQRDQNR